jgi:integrase
MKARGCRPRTIEVATSAVRHFLGEQGDLDDISTARLRQRIDLRLKTPTGRMLDGEMPRPRAVASVASELRQAKRFLRWAASRGIWRVPAGFSELTVEGPRSEGKEQLSADEARAFLEEGVRRARGGDEGALAAVAVLLLAVRSRELLDRRVRDLDDGGAVLWMRRWAKTRKSRRRVCVPEPLRTLLQEQVEDRQPGSLIFGELEGEAAPRSSSWLADQVRSLCAAAGVTVVCPHGLRGTHSTLAEAAGASPEVVAASLGHTSPAVTGRHYTLPHVRQDAQQERALKVMQGGRR